MIADDEPARRRQRRVKCEVADILHIVVPDPHENADDVVSSGISVCSTIEIGPERGPLVDWEMGRECQPIDQLSLIGASIEQLSTYHLDHVIIAGPREKAPAGAIAGDMTDVVIEVRAIKADDWIPSIAIKELTTKTVNRDRLITLLSQKLRETASWRCFRSGRIGTLPLAQLAEFRGCRRAMERRSANVNVVAVAKGARGQQRREDRVIRFFRVEPSPRLHKNDRHAWIADPDLLAS